MPVFDSILIICYQHNDIFNGGRIGNINIADGGDAIIHNFGFIHNINANPNSIVDILNHHTVENINGAPNFFNHGFMIHHKPTSQIVPANNFFDGFRAGYAGHFQNMWHSAVTMVNDPWGTAVHASTAHVTAITNDPLGFVSNPMMFMPSVGPTARFHQAQAMIDTFNTIWNDGWYGYGTIVGDSAAQGTIMAVSYGIGKAIAGTPAATQGTRAPVVRPAAQPPAGRYQVIRQPGEIRATQPVMPGTNIPRSFVMEGRYVNGREIWVHGNATKHMGEYVNAARGSHLVEREMMRSFQHSVDGVLRQPLQPGRNFYPNMRGWEIGIHSDTGVIYHALMR